MREIHITTCFLGLVLGNIFFAGVFAGNWDKCWDRSFFQGIALFALWLGEKIIYKGEQHGNDTRN